MSFGSLGNVPGTQQALSLQQQPTRKIDRIQFQKAPQPPQQRPSGQGPDKIIATIRDFTPGGGKSMSFCTGLSPQPLPVTSCGSPFTSQSPCLPTWKITCLSGVHREKCTWPTAAQKRTQEASAQLL